MVEKELAELHDARKNGMTQEEPARRLKTTKSAVSRLENRSGGARLETLEKSARAFGKR
jgi:transcriptional regulator